jgi:hypothetical protein
LCDPTYPVGRASNIKHLARAAKSILNKCSISLLFLALVPAGCASNAEIAQRRAIADDAKCRSYGAKPGDPAHVKCRTQLDAAHTQAMVTIASGGAAPAPAAMQHPPIVYPASPHPGRF